MMKLLKNTIKDPATEKIWVFRKVSKSLWHFPLSVIVE